LPRLNLRAKLLGSYGVIAVLMVVLSMIGITSLTRAASQSHSISADVVPSVQLIGTIDATSMGYRGDQLQHVISSTRPQMRQWDATIAGDARQVDKLFRQFTPLISDGTDRRLFDSAQSLWRTYLDQSAAAIGFSRQNKTPKAVRVLNGAAKTTYDRLQSTLDQWRAHNTEMGRAADRSAASSASSAKTLMLTLLILAVIAAATVSLLITRGINRSVADILDRLRSLKSDDTVSLKTGLEAVAAGDLSVAATPVTKPIERISGDEIGTVAEAVNEILENTIGSLTAYNASRESLSGLIGEVMGTAENVAGASQQMAASSMEAGRAVGEIANAVSDVAHGTERQVQAIESVRAATQQMSATTSESAERARQTAESAAHARETASAGATAVDQATEAMAAVREASQHATRAIGDLGAKSDQIGGIVDTITTIAEQTNLLALNAAIEAARAGEQGRGFAVVAEEVRKLAEESQSAAGSIATLIADIQADTRRAVEVVQEGEQRTDQGSATVEQARTAFAEINTQVEQISDQATQIADAVQELATTTAQMGSEVADVAAVAEQTSASSQEVSASTEETGASTQQIAASAQSLATTAQDLSSLVGRFTLA
jgi:methyl-accepting chemotaxis protein